jgi:hypothetical protein
MAQFLKWSGVFAAGYFARVFYVSRLSTNVSFDQLVQAAPEYNFEHCRLATSRPALRTADILIAPACVIFGVCFIFAAEFLFKRSQPGLRLTWRRVMINFSLLYVGPMLGVFFRVLGTKPPVLLPSRPFLLGPSVELLVALWKFSHPTSDVLLWASHSLAVYCFLVQIWCPSARFLMFIWASIAVAFLGDIVGHLFSDPVPFCVRQAFMQQWDSSSAFHVFFHESTAWLINLYSVMVVS